jgi:hypothetical protein
VSDRFHVNAIAIDKNGYPCYQSRHSALLSADDRQSTRKPGIGRLIQERWAHGEAKEVLGVETMSVLPSHISSGRRKDRSGLFIAPGNGMPSFQLRFASCYHAIAYGQKTHPSANDRE